MRTDSPPYWHGPFDLWNALVAVLLALAALALSLQGGGAPQQVAAPSIAGLAAGAALSADTPFELAGTAAPGATVKVYEGDKLLGEATAGPDGQWKLTVPGLAAGAHELVARSYSVDGKELAAQPFSLAVPAAAAQVTPGQTAEAGATAGPAAGVTPEAGKAFELTGTAAPGATVKVYEGDKLLGEATAGPDGKWTLTVPGLAAGAHDLVTRSYGADGKELAAQPFSLTVPGAAAQVTPGQTVEAAATPGLAGATPVAGAPLELTGIAAPGATAKVYEGDKLLGEATVGPDGKWALTLPGLAPGEHNLIVRLFGADGKEVAEAQPFGITVPGAEAAVTPGQTAEAAAAPGPAAGMPFELTGIAAPGATVKVYEGDKLLGEATVGPDGTWTLALPELAAGAHDLTLRLFSADGKELASQPLSITAPALEAAVTPGMTAEAAVTPGLTPEAAVTPAPAVVEPAAGATPEAGKPFELTGTAAPGATVKVFEGSRLVGEATAGPDGKWTLTVPGLVAGVHDLIIRLFGADGKELAAAQPFSIAVPEAKPSLTPPARPSPAPATQEIVTLTWPPNGSTVSSPRPLFTGQAFPRGVVRIMDGNMLLGETVVDSTGNWSFRPQTPLAPGQHTVTVVATSPDGKTTLETQPVSFTVPASAAFAPVKRASGTLAPAFAQPALGAMLSTLQPLFSGTATPNSVVRLYDGDSLLGEAVADADGQWSFRPSAPLSPGEHTIIAVPMNADGTEGALTTKLKLSLAGGLGIAPLQPPIVTGGLPAILSNNRPALAGQGTPGTTVRIYDGDKLLGEAVVGADGRWYFVPPTPLAPGDHVLRFEAVGADGKTAASAPLSLKVTEGARAVEPPTVRVPPKGQILPGTTLSGSAPPGSRLELHDGDRLVTAMMVGPNGEWRFTLPKTLPAGKHEYRVVVVDSAGIAVSESEILPLNVTAPLTLPITGASR